MPPTALSPLIKDILEEEDRSVWENNWHKTYEGGQRSF